MATQRQLLKAVAAYEGELDRWCLRYNKGRKNPCWEIVRNDEEDPTLISDKQTIIDAGQDDESASRLYDKISKVAAMRAAVAAAAK